MSEFKETQKMKVVQLYQQTPKQFLNPLPIPKIAYQGPKNKKDPKIKSKSNIIIERNIENKSCSTTLLDLKTLFNPNLTPKIVESQPDSIKPIKAPKRQKQSKNQVKFKCYRILKFIENKSCSTTLVAPKTVVELYSNAQTSPLGPQKDKPKLSQI